LEFTFTAQRIVVDEGAIDNLANEVASLGISKPLLVCSGRVGESTLVETISRLLKIPEAQIYSGVLSHPTVDIVEAGVDVARQQGIDGFVAVGGGSASDTAKAIAIVLAEGGTIADHASTYIPPDTYRQKLLNQPKLPLVAVPTTASAAEISFATAVTQGDIKLLISDPKVAARTVIYDVNIWRSIPDHILNTSLMNAIAHDIECAYSRITNPITQAISMKSFHLIYQVISSGLKESAAFHTLPLGVAMSGVVMQNARVGLHHAICHAIGSHVGCSHAYANSVILPLVLEYNLAEAKSVLAAFERLFSQTDASDDVLATRFIQRIRDVQVTLRVPTRLSDIGVRQAHIGRVAELAANDRGTYFNPRREPDTLGHITSILHAAM
jgi:alcohol dehydrogenase class IV